MMPYRVKLFLLVLLLVGGWACARAEPADPARLALPNRVELAIEAPAVITAGDSATIIVSAPGGPDGQGLTLLALGSFGPQPYRAVIRKEQALFKLTPDDTAYSGQVSLVTSMGASRAEGRLMITAGPASGTIPVWIGPYSVVADGQSETMLVAFPQDRLGNPAQNDTPVVIQLQHPQQRQVINTSVRNLLAWSYLRSDIVAGQSGVAVSAETANSSEQTFLEIPASPEPFTLTTPQTALAADGRQLVQVSTSPIKDRLGNLMLDGTTVTFLVTAPDGTRRVIPAITINGQAETTIEAPGRPGRLKVQAEVGGVVSQILRLTFTTGPMREVIDLAVTLSPETVAIKAGPLVGPLGQLVADGTPVHFQLNVPATDQQEFSVPSLKGYATLTLRRAILVAKSYEVRASAGGSQGRTAFRLD